MIRRALVICAALAAGCGGSSSDGGDPPGDDPDAASEECSPTAEIGACVDSATGEPCLDFDAATREFAPLGSGVVVQPILGPQGSEMYVLAIRGVGIDPGTVEDAPRAELVVFHSGEERGRFTSFPSFFADATVTDAFVAPQLFTVVFLAGELDGETLSVAGEVRNPGDGDRFCAESTFVGGVLIDPND